jgi:hypothetical protein
MTQSAPNVPWRELRRNPRVERERLAQEALQQQQQSDGGAATGITEQESGFLQRFELGELRKKLLFGVVVGAATGITFGLSECTKLLDRATTNNNCTRVLQQYGNTLCKKRALCTARLQLTVRRCLALPPRLCCCCLCARHSGRAAHHHQNHQVPDGWRQVCRDHALDCPQRHCVRRVLCGISGRQVRRQVLSGRGRFLQCASSRRSHHAASRALSSSASAIAVHCIPGSHRRSQQSLVVALASPTHSIPQAFP